MKSLTFKPTWIALVLGTACSFPALSNGPETRLIIEYKNTLSGVDRAAAREMDHLSQIAMARLQHGRYMHNGLQVVRVQDALDRRGVQDVVTRLQNDPDIARVEIDRLMQPTATANDTFYSLQWHYHDATAGINLEAAWDQSTGFGATVAVLDTGYRPHIDLAANLVGGYDMISDAFVGNDGNSGRDADASDPGDWINTNECGFPHAAQSSSWHGTHVAGTVAAVTNNNEGVAGVAYDALVVPVRVLGKCGGYTSDIADAIVWAAGGSVSGVPANSHPAQVINLSLGGSGSCQSVTQNAINTAVGLGAVVVVAAGNDNANVVNFTPGNCNNVVSVAATNKQADRASYSNFGNLIDVAAPGGEGGSNGVASTLNDGTTTPGSDIYVYYAGTSMAAPHVSGVAALMFAADPALSPATVESTLKSTARAFPGGSSCSTSTCGDGIVDAAAAVAAVSGGNLPPNASFSFSCTGLTCAFDGSGSSDADGFIVSHSWSFGGSGANVSHSFAASGTYNVTLTVSDDQGATDSQTQAVTVTDPSAPPISLSLSSNASGSRVFVNWSGANGSRVDIHRDGAFYRRTRNDGSYTDRGVSSGNSYTYQVCEQGSTSVCSAVLSITP